MNCLTILLFYCVIFLFGENKDPDASKVKLYYMRGRNVASKCEDEIFNRNCGITCGGKYTCSFEKCFCILHYKHSKDPKSAKVDSKMKDVIFVPDSVELDDSVEKVKELILRQASDNPLLKEKHSELRHHIAHFCENLEVARQCIKKCMTVGKPAFCGKDHVCYCGHKYDKHHKDPEVKPENVYNAFKDLYAKYFGSTEKSVKIKGNYINKVPVDVSASGEE